MKPVQDLPKQHLLIGIVLITILVGLGLFYQIFLVNQSKPKPTPPATVGMQRPDYSYTVTNISESEIMLDGPQGQVSISKDPSITSIYLGSSTKFPSAGFDSIQIGDQVEVEFIPGKLINIFVMSSNNGR